MKHTRCLKKIFLFSCVVSVLIIFFGCVGTGDWTYELPNGYEIVRVNSKTIIISGSDYRKVSNESNVLTKTYIDSYIIKFCYNDEYIAVQRVSSVDNVETEKSEYYIIDSINNSILGPFAEEEYISEIKTLNINNLSDWIPTVPKP